MAGLFDTWSNDPNAQAQMAMIAGLLSGRGSFNGVLGQALAGGQGSYNQARQLELQGQLGQANIADINAQAQQRQQAADQQRNLMDILANFYKPTAQPSTASQAMGATAAQGMLPGPTVEAGQVQDQLNARPPQPFNPYTQPNAFAKISAIKAMGGPDLTEQFKLAVGGIPQQEGTWVKDPNNPNAPPQFVPKVATSQTGQTSVTSMGPNGQLQVAAPQGAMQTYAGYQGLDKLINAATTVVSRKNEKGQTVDTSQLDLLTRSGAMSPLAQLLAGQIPGQPAPIAAPGQLKIPPQVQAARDSERLKILKDEYATNPTPELAREIKRAGGVVSGPTARQEAGMTTAGAEDAKLVATMRQKIPSLAASMRSLQILSDLNAADKTFAAAGAEWKKGFESVLQSIGLPSDTAKTANSELYIARVAELVKDRLASKDYGSGSGVSNLDLFAAGRPLPEISKTRLGRQGIIEALTQDVKNAYRNSNDAILHFDTQGSLEGFNFPNLASQINAGVQTAPTAPAQVRRFDRTGREIR